MSLDQGTTKKSSSTRPYMLRAIYEWCVDNGFTPHIAVAVDETVQVPMQYVKDGRIVLNVSMDATTDLKLGNDYISFKARFAGIAREVIVPLGRVIGIFARENEEGLVFTSINSSEPQAPAPEPVKPGTRPTFTRIK